LDTGKPYLEGIHTCEADELDHRIAAESKAQANFRAVVMSCMAAFQTPAPAFETPAPAFETPALQ
jgi:hypothetical protein